MQEIFKRPTFIALSALTALLLTTTISLITHTSALYGSGLIGTAILIILLFSRPAWLLLTLIIIRMSLDFFGEFTSLAITNNIHITLSQLIGLEVAFLGGLFFIAKNNNRQPLKKIWPFLMIFFWGIASLSSSISASETLRELLRIFDIFALFSIAYATIQTKRQFRLLLLGILVSSAIPVSVAAYQWITNAGLQFVGFDTQRIYGTFSHPNVFSLYLFSLVAFTALYYFLFAKTEWKKRLLLLLGVIYSTMLIATYTRIALVALIVFFTVLVIVKLRSLILPLIMIPTMLYFLVQPLQERVNQSFQYSPDSSLSWRSALWKDIVNETVHDDRTTFGYGMDTFPIVSERLRGIRLGSNDSHNDFVKFFVEGGIVGLSLFVFYILWLNLMLLMKSIRNKNDYANHMTFLVLFAFSFSLTIASITDDIFKNTPVQWLFWTVLGSSLRIFKDIPAPKKELS